MTSANAARAIARHPRRAQLTRAAGVHGRPPHRARPRARPASPMSAPPTATATISSRSLRARLAAAPAAALSRRRGPRRRSRRRSALPASRRPRWSIARSRPSAFRRRSRPRWRRARSTACCISPGAAPRLTSTAPPAPASSTRALAPCHFCLSRQVAEPLAAAGAAEIRIAARPDEAALIELVGLSPWPAPSADASVPDLRCDADVDPGYGIANRQRTCQEAHDQ